MDIRWLLDRQEELLGKELGDRDYSGLVAAVARHRVNTPRLGIGVHPGIRGRDRRLPRAVAGPNPITDIRALRLTVYGIADHLRSWDGTG
jgi:hypothetical protein